jgi:hypothetical protein
MLEQRIENSYCTLQEKEDYRKGICPADEQGLVTYDELSDQYKGDSECCVSRAVLQLNRARGGAGALDLLFI